MKEFLINCLCVGMGGFCGSILRYLIGFLDKMNHTGFPILTLIINFVGSFLLAFVGAYFASHLDIKESTILFLTVGLCGGFTTFSAFSVESLTLLQNGELPLAVLYVGASCCLCLLAAFMGQFTMTHLKL